MADGGNDPDMNPNEENKEDEVQDPIEDSESEDSDNQEFLEPEHVCCSCCLVSDAMFTHIILLCSNSR
jgi:hypothetical protein